MLACCTSSLTRWLSLMWHFGFLVIRRRHCSARVYRVFVAVRTNRVDGDLSDTETTAASTDGNRSWDSQPPTAPRRLLSCFSASISRKLCFRGFDGVETREWLSSCWDVLPTQQFIYVVVDPSIAYHRCHLITRQVYFSLYKLRSFVVSNNRLREYL